MDAGWVVLCAGTYGTPPILMRSGIGPADHLLSVAIPVRVDLPGVGENLADHPAVSIDCGYRGSVRAAPVLHSITTFHSTGRSSDETPDLMFWLSDPGRSSDGMSQFEIEVVLLRPRGRRTVRLRSADPAEAPLVELPNFRDDFDVARLAEGYDRALDVVRSPEIRSLCTGNVLEGPAAGRRRGRRRVRARLRSGATERRRRVDHARRAVRVYALPDDHAERLSDEIARLL